MKLEFEDFELGKNIVDSAIKLPVGYRIISSGFCGGFYCYWCYFMYR